MYVVGESKKERRCRKMREIREKGRFGEEYAKLQAALWGYKLKRTGRGHNFLAERTDISAPFSGKKERVYVEVKRGPHARLSKLQKKRKKKLKGRYAVYRPPF